MDRAVLVCKKFAELARTYGATQIVAVGTSAIREAKNQTEFLQRLMNETGLNVHMVSGLEEARLIYCGVSSGVDIGRENVIIIDLGGGAQKLQLETKTKSPTSIVSNWVRYDLLPSSSAKVGPNQSTTKCTNT